MTGLLDGKVAIVTGGSSGIGRASVERFVAEGARVVIADIADEAGSALVAQLGDPTIHTHADVTVEADIEAAVAAAVKWFGRLDVMFNNAGAVGDLSAITEIEQDGFEQAMALNVRSVLWGHKFAARQFRKQGTPGSIVTTASVAGLQGGWDPISYTTAKHAVTGIVRQAAKELSPDRIRSNALAPGIIMTPIQAKAFGVPVERAADLNHCIDKKLGSKQAMGRFGTAEDVANAALFLASNLSAYISGVVIPVDGGVSAITENSFGQDVKRVIEEFLQHL